MDEPRGPARPSRRAIVGGVLLAPLAGLGGCSPELDWREVREEEAGLLVTLPARPARMTRRIHLEDVPLDMTMVGAQVREIAYTVGTVTLAGPQSLERALAAMRIAMVRNIGGTERASRAVQVARVDPAGQRVGSVTGLEVEAIGRMRDRDAVLLARFVGIGAQAWQAVVLGAGVDREAAALFLESLKLIR